MQDRSHAYLFPPQQQWVEERVRLRVQGHEQEQE